MKRTRLTSAQKKIICEYREDNQNCSQSMIGQHFSKLWNVKIGRATISDILAQKDKWINFQGSDSVKSIKLGRNPDLEELLFQWIAKQCANNNPISDNLITETAKKLAQQMNIHSGFSKGWLQNFKKRFQIHVALHRDRDESDEIVESLLLLGRQNLNQIFSNICESNILKEEKCDDEVVTTVSGQNDEKGVDISQAERKDHDNIDFVQIPSCCECTQMVNKLKKFITNEDFVNVVDEQRMQSIVQGLNNLQEGIEKVRQVQLIRTSSMRSC